MSLPLNLNLLNLKLNLGLSNIKPLIYSLLGVSGVSLLISGWGDFQTLKVYEVSTGLKNQESYKVIERQFDRFKPTLPKGARVIEVSHIQQPSTALKIITSVVGVLSGTASLVLVSKAENEQDIREYVEYKSTEMQKLEIDNEVAAQHHISSEKSLVRAKTLMEELIQNKHYQELAKDIQDKEYGKSEGSETEKDESTDDWNPFSDEIDGSADDEKKPNIVSADEIKNVEIKPVSATAKFLTKEQINDLIQQYKYDGVPLQKALFNATGITKNDSNYRAIIAEINQELRNRNNG